MNRLHRSIAAALALLPLSSGQLGAQVATRIANVHYDLTFDSITAKSRTIKMSMTFDVQGGPVQLSLPVWTPGAYEITYFNRNIQSFEPTSAGKLLTWDKTSHSKYRIHNGSAKKVRIDYVYRADILDNAMSWSQPDFLLVNGTNVFLYPEIGTLSIPATVTVHTQPGWQVVTAMRPAGTQNTFRESNYHDLVDMPFFIGVMDVDSAQVNGKWNRLASYPAGKSKPEARGKLLEEIGKLLAVQDAVFSERPWQTYSTMIIYNPGGSGALEHQSSHVGVYSPQLIGTEFLTAITAHELFHAWNVKRMRPSEMWPYHYGAEQPTSWLWVSEGITDYYADVAMSRAGIGGADRFLLTTGGKIELIQASPPVALEDASLSTWIHPTDGTSGLYYSKGSLAGFMLDILIRDASDNRGSLDAVMRDVYMKTYKQNRGFTAQDWWSAVSRAAGGKSFAEFNAKYVDGRQPYPWLEVLPLAGLGLKTDTIRDARLGFSQTVMDDGRVAAAFVTPGGVAETAGVKVGDVFVSVGSVRIEGPESFPLFRKQYANGVPGSPLPIVVHRDNQDVTLNGTLRFVTRTETRLTLLAGASKKAVRIRNGILSGTN